MAHGTPYVRGGELHRPGHAAPVAVGGEAWWRWLDDPAAGTFRVEDADRPYTARRDRRGRAGYWYGYRRGDGRLHKTYLGRSADLTPERLQDGADQLARDPISPTSFVGRGTAVAEVARLLARTRVVVLVGPGGVGKTRLAAELTAAAGDAHPVGLASLADPALLAATVAGTLGLPDRSGAPPMAALVRALRDRAALLVLDNCEHLLDAAAALVTELVAACPRVRVLATSRAPLPVAGATTWRVPPLGVPGPDATAAAVLGSDAGRLFRARARCADPGFAVTDATAAAVALICRRLDGVPLALELAAGRLRALPVEVLAARLEDVLALPAAGVPAGHRTMREVIAWSHDLLDAPERTAFAQLGVFAGSWDLAGAEAVCAGSGALGVVAELVDKSLVQAVPGGRFRLLETVRGDARARLAARPEYDDVRARHAAHLLARIEVADPNGYDRASEQHYLALAPETDDLRAALRWCLARGEVALAQRFGSALAKFWLAHGSLREGRDTLAGLLALPGPEPAGVLLGAGMLAAVDGDYPAARPLLTRGLARARREDDAVAEAHGLYLLGLLDWWCRDYPGAWATAAEGVRVAEAADRPGMVGLCLWVHAQVALASRELDPAWRLADRALALCSAADHPLGVAMSLQTLGQVLLGRGDLAAARAMLVRSLAACDGSNWPAGHLGTLMAAVWTALEQGDPDQARVWARRGWEIASTQLSRARLCQPLEAYAQIAAARGEWERCATLLACAAALRDGYGIRATVPERARLDRVAGLARDALGPVAMDAATSTGRTTPAESVALEETGDPDGHARIPGGRIAPLTPRQSEVARLVAAGLSNRAVAARLGIAEPTVERHLGNTYRTLGVASRTQLAAWLRRERGSAPRRPAGGR